MTHDFRPGDVVEWLGGIHTIVSVGANSATITHIATGVHTVVLLEHLLLRRRDERPTWQKSIKLIDDDKPAPTPTEHPSRARAASSLRAASASLTTAIDHLTRAGEAETYPGQTVIRIRTASEETQACIQHATMALYWMLHERLS